MCIIAKMDQVFSKENKTLKKYWKIGKNTGKVREFCRSGKVGTLCYYCCVLCRDLVHRQTSMSAIQHMALGVYGFGCEDALNHLLNHVWPNIFESSPHVVQAFMGAVEGMRVGLGPAKILQYSLQVM